MIDKFYLRFLISDEKYMARCLQLAALGKGSVAPNPVVGAVIVYDGKIIGEGYHMEYGGSHAEVNAINSIKDISMLHKSTIYVSLEPCAHHGKTPPCANLLIKHSFQRAVIGCTDSYSKVNGKGIKKLKKAGIETKLGVLTDECRLINRHYFTFHEQKRPYVLLKWAQTQNGLIDNNNAEQGEVTWISAPETKVKVHAWRSEHQAILVGKNTVITDNPNLTVRAIKGKNPIRIVLDSNLQLSGNVNIKNNDAPTIILNKVESKTVKNLQYIKVDQMVVSSILDALYQNGIQSVLIEGGRATLQSFIDSGLWDEARVIIGVKKIKQGTAAPKITSESYCEEMFFTDKISYYKNR